MKWEGEGMRDFNELSALEVNGETISLGEVLRWAKWQEQLAFVQAATDAALLRQAAAARALSVTDDELQQAADDFRSARALYEADALTDWLADRHLTLADWEALLEEELLTAKLRAAVTAGQVEQYFAQHKLSFDAATLAQIVVRDEQVARELRAQIVEEGAYFQRLARQYSIDEATRPAGGYVGRVKRTELEAAVEAAVFGARPGQLLGPFKTALGWSLFKVEALHRATLDAATRHAIESRLFDEWLAQQRRRARVRTRLLEVAAQGEAVAATA